MRKRVVRDLFVLCIAMTGVVCAAVNLHVSLNMMGEKDK